MEVKPGLLGIKLTIEAVPWLHDMPTPSPGTSRTKSHRYEGQGHLRSPVNIHKFHPLAFELYCDMMRCRS